MTEDMVANQGIKHCGRKPSYINGAKESADVETLHAKLANIK
jgi:hypothetical protein